MTATGEFLAVLSALLMLRRLANALRYARREEDWDRVAGAGALLVGIGIAVEVVRRLGVAFVAVQERERAAGLDD